MAATVYRYECTNGGHSKFWEIEFVGGGRTFITRWGRIGTDGLSGARAFKTIRQCTDARLKLMRSKTAKGYVLAYTDQTASANIKIETKPHSGFKPMPLVLAGTMSLNKSTKAEEEEKMSVQEPTTYQRPKRRVRLK